MEMDQSLHWKKMTVLHELYKLKACYLLFIVSNKSVHMLGKDSHLTTNEDLLQQMVSVEELIMDKVPDQVSISPIIMLIDVDKVNTVLTCILGESKQPELYITSVMQWDPDAVEFYKPIDKCFVDLRLVEVPIYSSLLKQSIRLKNSLFTIWKSYLDLRSWRYCSWCFHLECDSDLDYSFCDPVENGVVLNMESDTQIVVQVLLKGATMHISDPLKTIHMLMGTSQRSLMVMLPLTRPWDPGIPKFDLMETRHRCLSGLIVNQEYHAENEHRRLTSDHVVAWGQATFCGGGNVRLTSLDYPFNYPSHYLFQTSLYKQYNLQC